jgi:hypothetical protein
MGLGKVGKMAASTLKANTQTESSMALGWSIVRMEPYIGPSAMTWEKNSLMLFIREAHTRRLLMPNSRWNGRAAVIR